MAPHAKKFAFTTSREIVEDTSKAVSAEYCDFIQHFIYEDDDPVLWIFGYGSLIWLPKIEYTKSEKGFVKDYALRFWQGNTTHRGTPESPGRVATLIHEKGAETWGKAFQLRGVTQINEGLKHLCGREMTLGGYSFERMRFQVQGSSDGQVINAVTFIATPNNSLYLGPASITDIAYTIVHSKGKSGHNLEYLFRLTDSLRAIASELSDPHLQILENACHAILASKLASNDDYIVACLSSRQHLIAASKDSVLYNTFCNIGQE